MKIDSKKLLTNTRFDVIIKYMYAKAILKGYDTTYFKDIYKNHIGLWNGFKEYDNPDKNSFEKFDETFKELIDGIDRFGFDENISQIPVYNGVHILNGAHRLAAALAVNKPVDIIEGDLRVDGQLDCSSQFFKNIGISDSILDRTTIEYAKLKKNSLMVFIFPSAKENRNKVFEIINRWGRIFYSKSVSLNSQGAFNLIQELYLNEPWVGDFNNGFSGVKYKQQLCYPNYNPTTGFLVEFNSLGDAIQCKRDIRNIYTVGKHCIHVNDTHEETVKLAKLIFNDNSIHNLNNAKTVNYTEFNKRLDYFKNNIMARNLEIDDYCITGSSSLSAYGLREGSDLDYLCSTKNKDADELFEHVPYIDCHNDYSVGRYHLNIDEIIYDPHNHFYYNGVKFASLEVIKQLKLKRLESKDKIDIDLINTINQKEDE